MIPCSRALVGTACALALAACAPESQPQDAADAEAVPEQPTTAPADLGRGGMLNQRADQAEQAIRAAQARGVLPQSEADAMLTEIGAARAALAERLAQSTGALPQADRQAVSGRLAAVESRLAALGPPSTP